MTKKNIGERIRTVRKSLRLNQGNVADKVHVTIQTLSRYENGARFPDSLFLQEFGKSFKVNANWLLYGKGDMFLKESEVHEITHDRQQGLQNVFDRLHEKVNRWKERT